ncbi:hypothetical protein AAHH72_10870 [Bacillus cereus]
MEIYKRKMVRFIKRSFKEYKINVDVINNGGYVQILIPGRHLEKWLNLSTKQQVNLLHDTYWSFVNNPKVIPDYVLDDHECVQELDPDFDIRSVELVMTIENFYSEKRNSETVIASYNNYGGGEYINYLQRRGQNLNDKSLK